MTATGRNIKASSPIRNGANLGTHNTGLNWRAVVALRITPAQQATVSELNHRLLLCHYEDMWHPPTLDGRTEGEVCTDARFWLWHNVRFGNRLTAP